jgi:hypothetical protein
VPDNLPVPCTGIPYPIPIWADSHNLSLSDCLNVYKGDIVDRAAFLEMVSRVGMSPATAPALPTREKYYVPRSLLAAVIAHIGKDRSEALESLTQGSSPTAQVLLYLKEFRRVFLRQKEVVAVAVESGARTLVPAPGHAGSWVAMIASCADSFGMVEGGTIPDLIRTEQLVPSIAPQDGSYAGGCFTVWWSSFPTRNVGMEQDANHTCRAAPQRNSWLDKLDDCRLLEVGWDSYSAPAPSAMAVENAKALVKDSENLGTVPDRVEPSAMGGIGLTFAVGNREVAIEFYNKGTAHALFSDATTGMMHTQAVQTDPDGRRGIIREVQKYLYAE